MSEYEDVIAEKEMINVLPDEVLEQIFHHLPLHVLGLVLLVCRRWRQIGESPWLWTRARLRVTQEMMSELLTAMVQHPRLRELDMNYMNLSMVNPMLLATAVNKMMVVDIRSTQLTLKQADSLFSMMSEGTQVRSLKIGPNNLSSLNPDMLATAVHRLEWVEMRGTRITRQQITTILTRKEKTSLQYLDIRGNWAMRGIPKSVMKGARENISEILS